MVFRKKSGMAGPEEDKESPSARLVLLAEQLKHLADEVSYTARVLREEKVRVRE